MIPDEEIAALDAVVEHAIVAGDESALRVVGYGEISLALGWPADDPRWVCKRLPVFPDRDRYEANAVLVERYLAVLRAHGVEPVETELRAFDRPDGTVVAYAVQPLLPSESLGPVVLAAADPASGHPLVRAVVEAAAAVVGPEVGLDSQLSNWAWLDGELRYLDVTTPFLRRPDGESALDADLLLAAIPWALRGSVRRFLLPGIIGRYHRLRPTLVDVCANLIKERLEPWLPRFLEATSAVVDRPVTEEEVQRYYASDARTWRFMLAVRRADRWWQRTVRRRPYPFLLPRHVER